MTTHTPITPLGVKRRLLAHEARLSELEAPPVPRILNTFQTFTAPVSTWYDTAWSPQLELFCAVNNSNQVGTSRDGTTWTAQTVAGNRRCIAWSAELGLFCAAGGSGHISVSSDGFNWENATNPLPDNRSWNMIIWSKEKGIFCAVADGGTGSRVAISSNGRDWFFYDAFAGGETLQWKSVAWSAHLNLFCAVAANGQQRIMTSPDGQTWTAQQQDDFPGPAWFNFQDIEWSEMQKVFCIVADAGSPFVQLSTDGVTWRRVRHGIGGNPFRILWISDLDSFVIFHFESPALYQLKVSRDGERWEQRQPPVYLIGFQACAWSSTLQRLSCLSWQGIGCVVTNA
jgi:hypothetical protein